MVIIKLKQPIVAPFKLKTGKPLKNENQIIKRVGKDYTPSASLPKCQSLKNEN
jgi:hypothetical protein